MQKADYNSKFIITFEMILHIKKWISDKCILNGVPEISRQ